MTNNEMELKACPCGKIPEKLHISGNDSKWAWVSAMCCNEWNIEFRTGYYKYNTEECMKLATAAWNDATRTPPSGGESVLAVVKKAVEMGLVKIEFCGRCSGSGDLNCYVPDPDAEFKPCPICSGNGFTITEGGQK